MSGLLNYNALDINVVSLNFFVYSCIWIQVCFLFFLFFFDLPYICHRHGKGFRKEMTRFGIFLIFGIFGVDASGCMDELWQFFHTCTVVFPLK